VSVTNPPQFSLIVAAGAPNVHPILEQGTFGIQALGCGAGYQRLDLRDENWWSVPDLQAASEARLLKLIMTRTPTARREIA